MERRKKNNERKKKREALLTQEELVSKPKMPPNAYMRFCQRMRESKKEDIVAEVEAAKADNNKLTQVQVLGQWWKKLTKSEQKMYDDAAAMANYSEAVKEWNERVKARKRGGKPPPVKNSYMRFLEHMHKTEPEEIRAMHVSGGQAEVARLISSKWENMGAEEKAPFQKAFEEERDRVMAEFESAQAEKRKGKPKAKVVKKRKAVAAAAPAKRKSKKGYTKAKISVRKDKASTDEFGTTHNLVVDAAGSDEEKLPDTGMTLADLLNAGY